MNRIDEWTQFITKCLKSETELLGIQSRHDLYEDSARDTFIRVVLDQFLPGSFAVGSGRVIDAAGNSSNELDIVIYRRDFPQLNLPGSTNVFLYESVLATIEVKTKVVRKSFFEALDNCASMGELNPAVNTVALRKLARRNGLVLNENEEFVHQDPLKTARFNLVGRPPAFVYAFSGYQTSLKQLKENIDLWISYRRKKKLNYDMKSFPSVIATQGCFAWRNAAPLSVKKNVMLGLGNDKTPVRLIILHLMNALNRRLRGTDESSGMNLNLDAYISNIDPPVFTSSCGKVINPGAVTTTTTPIVKETDSTPVEKKAEPAPVAKVAATVEKKIDRTPVVAQEKPAPQDEIKITASAEKKAAPDPIVKKPVSTPAADSKSEEPAALETYDVFKSPPEAAEPPAQETSPATGSTMKLGGNVPDIADFIEPELAQPEFIEPEIIEPEPEPEPKPAIDLKTKPEPDDDPFESTMVMSSSDARQVSKSTIKSEPELKDKPDPVEDPLEATMVLSSGNAEKEAKPAIEAEPESKDIPEPESDPFSETIRMPTHELEQISAPKKTTGSIPAKDSNPLAKNGQTRVSKPDVDPFSRTIPQ